MTAPYYQDDLVALYLGDCVEVMATLPADSVDSIVTDPPYGLGFMGKAWDALPPGEEWARECLRVLKPGGHLLAFGGTRTWHRLAVAVEDAGFELRDSIAWLYGSGFPKSLDVSKAIDKAAGVEFSARPAAGVGFMNAEGAGGYNVTRNQLTREGETTDAAREWQGWGTALKPAFEPIVVGRKPLIGTVAANVLMHGTGALNIDGCRIEGARPATTRGTSASPSSFGLPAQGRIEDDGRGRWPANVVLDPAAAAELDAQSGVSKSRTGVRDPNGSMGYHGGAAGLPGVVGGHDDAGGASRFFYVAKAPARERPQVDGHGHPTVKPLALMRWLVRLVTPPGGTVLEPFLGSGTTAEACIIEGFLCIGIERDTEHMAHTKARLAKPIQPDIFGGAA